MCCKKDKYIYTENLIQTFLSTTYNYKSKKTGLNLHMIVSSQVNSNQVETFIELISIAKR